MEPGSGNDSPQRGVMLRKKPCKLYIQNSRPRISKTIFIYETDYLGKITLSFFFSSKYNYFFFFIFPDAAADDTPLAMKLKKMWFKTPVNEEQAAQAILDPALGEFTFEIYYLNFIKVFKKKIRLKTIMSDMIVSKFLYEGEQSW